MFRHYTTQDGLSNNTIFTINQDNSGYIWFGTDAGVSRFDGYKFDNQLIPVINNNEAFTQSIEKGKDGMLIFACFMQEIIVEQGDGSFKQFLSQPKRIGKNTPNTLKAYPDGRLLVSHGRFLYLFSDTTFKRIYDCGIDRNAINSLELDSQNNIWFGGYFGVGVIYADDTTYTPYFIPELKDINIVKVKFNERKLLVGSRLGYYELDFSDFKRGKLKYSVSQPFKELKELYINNIYIDNQKITWIATSTKGAFKVKNNKIIENISDENGLPSASVMCIFQDREDVFWFGTPDGVSKLGSFTDYSYTYNSEPVTDIGILLKDRLNRTWMWDGINLYVEKDTKLQRIDLSKTPIKDQGIKYMVIDRSNCLYLLNDHAFYKARLVKNGIDLKLKLIVDFDKTEASRLRCCLVDTSFILFGFDNGVYAFKNNQFGPCIVKSDKPLNLRPVQIVKDNFGYYWMGDFTYGLYRMSLKEQKDASIEFDDILTYKSLKPDSSFVNAWIQDLIIDNKGFLWQSSLYTGVYKLKIDRNGVVEAKLFDTNKGLSSNNVTQIIQDYQHNIWFATSNGADYLRNEGSTKEAIIHFNKTNGFSNQVFDILPGDSLVQISFDKGVYAINLLSNNDLSKRKPKILISSVSIMGVVDSLALHTAKKLKLPYNKNFISFDFVALLFTHESGIQYQYKLVGLDNKWSQFTDRRYVSYNSLAPGKYEFLLRARTTDGLISDQTASFKFIIRSPFYKTGWFISIVLLVVFSIVYFAYHYKLKQILKLELLRTRIASDLHDEVGSTLSSISILSELLSRSPDSIKSKELIGKIGFNARNTLESMDDIIWAVSPTNDKFQNLGLRIREFAIPLFESKEIKFKILFPEQIALLHLPMEIRRNVYLIAKEAINNLVKYSECTIATIEFKEHSSILIMEIKDNGKGFNTDAISNRNGLKNIKRRASQIKANLEIISAEGEGCSIALHLKII